VSLIGDFVRLRLSAKAASLSISFWKSAWGVRLGRIAGIGVKAPARPLLGMPMLTEIASAGRRTCCSRRCPTSHVASSPRCPRWYAGSRRMPASCAV